MTLDETLQRIHTIVDQLLVQLAEDPESRFLFTLPSLTENEEVVPILDCQEYCYGIARLREVLTYKYLLGAVRHKLLVINREFLAVCIRNMRQSPVVDYYDLGDYHEYAFYYYKKSGNEKKANRHLLACYMDRGRAILSAEKVFDCKDLVVLWLKDRQRMQSLLLYVVNFILRDFEDVQETLKRSQYLLLERVMVLAEKLFAENVACATDLRSCIYYVQSTYYALTGRPEEAKRAKKNYLKLGGHKNYGRVLTKYMASQPTPHLMDQRFVDYMLYANALEENDVYPMDEEGNILLEQTSEESIVTKDGRTNFMDSFYRMMPSALNFRKVYEAAERGDVVAIGNLVRRYREGDGVAICERAALAWERCSANPDNR